MTLREFLSWWKAQLLSLVPQGLIGRLTRHGRRITLTIDGEQTAITPPDHAESKPLQLGDPGLESLKHSADSVLLKLSENDYLLQRFMLPRVALTNLAEAVGYQIPKLMPFNRDQVLFACGSEAEKTTSEQVSVWVVAVPRRRLTDALSALRIPLPESPIAMQQPPRPGGMLKWSWRLDRREGGQQKLQKALWWGVAAVWMIAGVLTIVGQQRDYASLQATHDELRREAAVVGQLRERLDLAQQQLDDLLQRRQLAVTPLQLLNELTETLGDDTWLTNLELQGDELSMQGVSPTPAALIEALEDTTLLRDVQFDAAITQAGAGEGRRFNISARTDAAGGVSP